jgi:hypothetical protein
LEFTTLYFFSSLLYKMSSSLSQSLSKIIHGPNFNNYLTNGVLIFIIVVLIAICIWLGVSKRNQEEDLHKCQIRVRSLEPNPADYDNGLTRPILK